jgi:hypothetical protein
MIGMTALFAASLGCIASAQPAADPKGAPVALERKLHGGWRGGPCMGDWTFASDGTFAVRHYSPGNHTLTGTWKVRWDALPPTLVTACKASDDARHVGKTWEVKLTQLDDEVLAYRHPDGRTTRYERVKK